VLGDIFGLPLESGSQSQKSSLFPWDGAGFASSSSHLVPLGSDRAIVDQVDTRLRHFSDGPRESPVGLSRPGSAPATSPLLSGGPLLYPEVGDDNFAFDGGLEFAKSVSILHNLTSPHRKPANE
jgi:meiotic recombination protein REC8, fungi type